MITLTQCCKILNHKSINLNELYNRTMNYSVISKQNLLPIVANNFRILKSFFCIFFASLHTASCSARNTLSRWKWYIQIDRPNQCELSAHCYSVSCCICHIIRMPKLHRFRIFSIFDQNMIFCILIVSSFDQNVIFHSIQENVANASDLFVIISVIRIFFYTCIEIK